MLRPQESIVAPTPRSSSCGLLSMASLDSGEDDNKTKGNLWALDKTLDEPMDEDAGKLRDMHNEKVTRKKEKKNWFCDFPIIPNWFLFVVWVER